MNQLVVIVGDEKAQEFPLELKRVRLGRDQHNEICLDDKSVSRVHATIDRIYKNYFIEDEGSTNGTLVNGARITKQRMLKDGDEITIGKYKLRFLVGIDEAAEDEEDGNVILIRPVDQVSDSAVIEETPEPISDPTPPSETQPQTTPVSTEKSDARVRFLAGMDQGEVRILSQSFNSIGQPGSDLLVINRRHDGYYLVKMGGSPMLNGQPAKAGGMLLRDGDKIRMNDLELEFIL